MTPGSCSNCDVRFEIAAKSPALEKYWRSCSCVNRDDKSFGFGGALKEETAVIDKDSVVKCRDGGENKKVDGSGGDFALDWNYHIKL